jgi:hypothetical protein
MIAEALSTNWWMGLPQQAEPDWHSDEWTPTWLWCLVRFLTGVLIGMIIG